MKKFAIPVSLVCAVAIAAASFVWDGDKTPAHAESEKIVELSGETSIEKLFNADIVEGYEDGELHPELMFTRAQFAKILNKAFESENEDGSDVNFSDVDKTHWAYEDIKKAVESGLLEGFPDGTFRPDENITFEQAVTVVCRALNLNVYGSWPDSYVSIAIDYALTDHVNALIGDELTREQAAQIIVNSLDFVGGQIEGGIIGGGGGSYKAYAMPESAMPMESLDIDGLAFDEYSGMVTYIPPLHNTEEYVQEAENVFKNPRTSPLSTFSIDTDTASYSNLRRFILKGQDIPQGAIRIEELINYFDYAKAQADSTTPFAVRHTVAPCPWNSEHKLAMITVSGEELTQKKPSNIVFLIDTSGSMYEYNKLPLVKQSLAMLLDNLDENDTVSIVTYASDTGVALEPTPASEKEKIMEVINGLSAGGSTAGESGINLAYEQAEKAKIDGNNRVILCTDGDFNVGTSSDAELENLISAKRDSGIYLSVLGFGMGNYKDNKMETLADNGNGNYAYIDNLREAKKVLVDDMSKTIYTIAKDVKIQVEFNPEKVGSYRLIGYENRMLNDEDFENDEKDAGELGAGATVTVFYEIIPSSGEAHSELNYQSSETSGSGELMTVSVRYKLPEAQESELVEYPVSEENTNAPDEDFWFACAVAEFGMLVNGSEYAANASYDSVIELARKGIGDDPFGIRCEFVQLVDLFAQSR